MFGTQRTARGLQADTAMAPEEGLETSAAGYSFGQTTLGASLSHSLPTPTTSSRPLGVDRA
jgi:hypothetical protein